MTIKYLNEIFIYYIYIMFNERRVNMQDKNGVTTT